MASPMASLSSPTRPKPGRLRSPSDPINSQTPPPPSQIYVLSADGSSLFLLDPTAPRGNEEPPPYAPFRDAPAAEPEAGTPQRTLSQVHLPAVTEPRHPTDSRRPRVRGTNSFSHSRRRSPSGSVHAVTARSSPIGSHQGLDERAPLLPRPLEEEWTEIGWYQRRGHWRAILCGELEEGDEGMKWMDVWKRFWRPVGQARYWKAMAHLCFLNFPFALFVWPPLIAGTLAGTALLITLPIGAAVWWLTLYIARSAARLETITQLNYHSPLRPYISQPKYRPIFYYIKTTDPVSPLSETPPEVVWEKRFIKCSYAMFCDHYSYSALSYFLLIKPLIVLFSTILLWALFPVAVALIFGLPMYLRAARRWGQWQAGIAIENL